ncbi:hypothetical protein MJM59_27055, partial [Salmonella enterica subsp. enterica serovar Montevideo]|nr:hypothetical protein [Salmonella enterica subsp. enterica serovar Montevideo]
MCTTFCLTASEKGRRPAVFLSVENQYQAPQLRGFFLPRRQEINMANPL